jgi:hypothetical protein
LFILDGEGSSSLLLRPNDRATVDRQKSTQKHHAPFLHLISLRKRIICGVVSREPQDKALSFLLQNVGLEKRALRELSTPLFPRLTLLRHARSEWGGVES